jgi:Kef-type K+ transport system membrane component KefB
VSALASLGDALASPLAADLTKEEARSLVLVFLASALGALLARWHIRLLLPTIVVEIVLGILIGPDVLGIAEVGDQVAFLADFGLALLFFFAGLEVVERHVPREALARGTTGWGISLALGLLLGLVLEQAGLDVEWWLLAVALATTSLGTLVPVLSDAKLLPTPFGRAVLGTGVAGEFWPIIFISIFLTSVYGAVTELLLLLGFGVLVAGAARIALGARPPWFVRVVQDTLHTTGQVGVRASIFLLALLVFVAGDAGFEFVLGAFAAGLVVGLVLDSPAGRVVRLRLEGIGFGFLVPVYFVVTGMNFDLDSLLTLDGVGLAALFLVLLVVTRGASALLWLRELGARGTAALALCGATALPLVVAIVGIAQERGAISDAVGASLIGAGMLSVLVYPLTATRLMSRDVGVATGRETSPDDGARGPQVGSPPGPDGPHRLH